jgi:hypothetical protein
VRLEIEATDKAGKVQNEVVDGLLEAHEQRNRAAEPEGDRPL